MFRQQCQLQKHRILFEFPWRDWFGNTAEPPSPLIIVDRMFELAIDEADHLYRGSGYESKLKTPGPHRMAGHLEIF